ncbi:translation initiation factor 3 subunit Eif3i [Acrasis kona]|uniref:Eukaryotic translation initiation factor 3 subunit I n=1 Tax=Acrasis kona TaxID=1008807 RepID=A0AAW2Z3I7_9EUKA
MKPFLLHAHTKPISWIKFNREGDLIFVASKDALVTVWHTHNGELLGSYQHSGAVTCLDVDDSTTRLITACADQNAYLWDIQTGKLICQYSQSTPVRSIQFAEGGNLFLCVTDASYKNTPSIQIYSIPKELYESNKPCEKKQIARLKIEQDVKITHAVWGPLNETIICGCVDGSIRQYDSTSGQCLGKSEDHHKDIIKIALSKDKMLLISASLDNTAKLYETKTLELLKTYKSNEPVNTAAISPYKNHIVLAGGIAAQDVTLSLGKSTYFNSKFFHKVFENKLGEVRGHFGPIHILAFTPDGHGFASGGEDGYVRLHYFDKDVLEMNDGPDGPMD